MAGHSQNQRQLEFPSNVYYSHIPSIGPVANTRVSLSLSMTKPFGYHKVREKWDENQVLSPPWPTPQFIIMGIVAITIRMEIEKRELVWLINPMTHYIGDNNLDRNLKYLISTKMYLVREFNCYCGRSSK